METTYRTILQQALADRSAANPSYSLRSFAKDLGSSASSLSEVINGRKGFSPKKAAEVAQRLRLPEWQTHLFCDLVTSAHAKSPRVRKEAAQKLKNRRTENRVHLLKQESLRALTSWVDLAILELTHLETFKPSLPWIAERLGVPKNEVKDSVTRLRGARLLLQDDTGKWVDSSPLFSSSDGISNESIRRFHRTVLLLALKKLENIEPQTRVVKTVVFSVSETNRGRARAILDEAIGKIVALADESEQTRSDVMCFSTQLFSLLESK